MWTALKGVAVPSRRYFHAVSNPLLDGRGIDANGVATGYLDEATDVNLAIRGGGWHGVVEVNLTA